MAANPTVIQDKALQVKRNAFMRLRFSSPPKLDLLLEDSTFEILDHDVVRAIVLADSPISSEKLVDTLNQYSGAKAYRDLVHELIEVGILVNATYQHPLQDAAEHWQKRGWLDALVLHLRSRNIPYDDFGDKKFVRTVARENDAAVTSGLQGELANPDGGEIVKLEQSGSDPFQQSLHNVMAKRRSGRSWTGKSMSLQLLGDILYYSNLESRRNREKTIEDGSPDRCAIFDHSSYSALETYVVVNEVKGLATGVYRYLLEGHQLQVVAEGDYRTQLVEMCIGQEKVRGCSVAFLIAAHWQRYFSRYQHSRAYRNLLINTAELAHYYILTATAAELSNFITPAFNDEIAEGLLRQRATQVGPLYMVSVG